MLTRGTGPARECVASIDIFYAVLEIGFGAVLVANRHTTAAAAVATVSLAATTLYLLLVGLTQGGIFLDVMVRDVGLTALAAAVLVQSLD